MLYSEATTHTTEEGLIWDTDGYYPVGSDTWRNSIATLHIKYMDGMIGVIPRFDSYISYIVFTMNNINKSSTEGTAAGVKCIASLNAYIGGQDIHLGEKELSFTLIPEAEYEIKTVVSRTNYKVYVNNELIFNTEYNGLHKGAVAIVGAAGTICKGIEIHSDYPVDWATNADEISGAMVTLKEFENKDKYMYLDNPSANKTLLIEQVVEVNPEQSSYTVSYDGQGDVVLVLREIAGNRVYFIGESSAEEWKRSEYSIVLPAGTRTLGVCFHVEPKKSGAINNVQVEEGVYSTGYIHNEARELTERKASYVTYPAKNSIISGYGTISMWVKSLITYDNSLDQSPVLFEYGNEQGLITLYHEKEGIRFAYGDDVITGDPSEITTMIKDQWYHVLATWNGNQMNLYINGVKTTQNGMYTFSGASELIRIGHSTEGKDIFNGAIDEVIVYSRALSEEEVVLLAEAKDPVPKTDDMILRATFDHAIGNFNRSVIEMTPAPVYGGPVLMEKADGTSMRKVSFFDPFTGNYRTYNEEQVFYDGYSDYVKVSYDHLDEDNFKIKVQDYTGSLYGDPYRVEGRRIYMTLSAETKKDLKNKPLWVSYQPENAFTVEHVSSPSLGSTDDADRSAPSDVFRATIGKYDGQPVSITYEGNRFSDEKLATMVELNPLLNPNHEGFLYIARVKQEVSTFRAKATPDDLAADGISESIVVIEPLDLNGNFISNAKLEVTTDLSTSSIIPNYDPGSILVRERAGRYLYKYRAPLLYFKDINKAQTVDYIHIKDKISGVGVQVPIYLALSNEYYNTIATPTLEEDNWERVAARLLDAVMDYFMKEASDLPKGLGQILDFDEDGIIDLKEIIWINQYKHTQALYNKYVEYLNWKVLNG